MLKRTPLHDRHVALGADLVDFAGYAMPVKYSGMREEHIAVRQRAGMFDLSHMGEVELHGGDGVTLADRLVANDVGALAVGGSVYGVMCGDDGGIVDDVIAYRDADGVMVVVNASCRDKDVRWMAEHAGGVTVDDRSDDTALIAVQGPRALGIVGRLTDTDISALPSFHHLRADVAGVAARVARTGYTGEDGVELYVDASSAGALWDALLEAGSADGLLPCGLGARDTLRLEAGLRLYGQDMDDTTDPYSCGLGWTVKLDGRDPVGAPALRALRDAGAPRRFVGLELGPRSIARHGQPVLLDGEVVGVVTSGTFSFTLGHPIATASVLPEAAGAEQLQVDIRGVAAPARRVRLPFYRRPA